jgi:hypothetical protein
MSLATPCSAVLEKPIVAHLVPEISNSLGEGTPKKLATAGVYIVSKELNQDPDSFIS